MITDGIPKERKMRKGGWVWRVWGPPPALREINQRSKEAKKPKVQACFAGYRLGGNRLSLGITSHLFRCLYSVA